MYASLPRFFAIIHTHIQVSKVASLGCHFVVGNPIFPTEAFAIFCSVSWAILIFRLITFNQRPLILNFYQYSLINKWWYVPPLYNNTPGVQTRNEALVDQSRIYGINPFASKCIIREAQLILMYSFQTFSATVLRHVLTSCQQPMKFELLAITKRVWNGKYEMWTTYFCVLHIYTTFVQITPSSHWRCRCIHLKEVLWFCSIPFSVPRFSNTLVDMTSAHGEELFGMSILKLDCASRMMHLNFWRQWDICLIISGLDTAC